MATPTDITKVAPVNETFDTVMNSYDTVNTAALPNQKDSMGAYMLDSMLDLKRAVDTYNRQQAGTDTVLTDDEIAHFKDGVEDSFYDVKNSVKPANEYFWETGTYDKTQIEKILTQYAAGYYQYTQLCNGSAPVVAVENWNKTNSDATINCAGLVTSQKDIEYIVGASFIPVTVSPDQKKKPFKDKDNEGIADSFSENDTSLRTNSNLYFRFASGGLSMDETQNADALDLEPFATDTATLGLFAPLKNQYLFSQVPWGGPSVGVTYSHTADGDFTAGSQRFLLAAEAGFKQPLYRFDVGPVALGPYLTPSVTAGYSQSKLNFGQGMVPESQDAMMIGATALAGLEVCSKNLGCLAAFYKYQYDRSLVGDPAYQSWGGSAGLELSVALPDLTKKKD